MLCHNIFYAIVVLAEVLVLELDHLVVLVLQGVELPDQLVELHHGLTILLRESLQQLTELLVSRLRAVHWKHDVNSKQALDEYNSLAWLNPNQSTYKKITSYLAFGIWFIFKFKRFYLEFSYILRS